MSPGFPGGREFAFTILDDTDDTTVSNGRPIYGLLRELGLRTTKTVWALDTPAEHRGPFFAAETLQDRSYFEWVKELQQDGFEIAFHNASMASSKRERTLTALDLLRSEFDGMPRLHCNHARNRENVYWGASRYSAKEIARLTGLLQRRGHRVLSEGHKRDSEYFWGDLLRERIEYTRRFAFRTLDCSTIPPSGVFVDSVTPYVRHWFNTADAPDARAFKRLVTPTAVDRLRARGGWSIVSTHLGKGFVSGGRVDEGVSYALEYVADQGGWFVPASDILDFLVQTGRCYQNDSFQVRRMEYAHIADRVLTRLRGLR